MYSIHTSFLAATDSNLAGQILPLKTVTSTSQTQTINQRVRACITHQGGRFVLHARCATHPAIPASAEQCVAASSWQKRAERLGGSFVTPALVRRAACGRPSLTPGSRQTITQTRRNMGDSSLRYRRLGDRVNQRQQRSDRGARVAAAVPASKFVLGFEGSMRIN